MSTTIKIKSVDKMKLITEAFLDKHLFNEFPELLPIKKKLHDIYLDESREYDENRLHEAYGELAFCLDPSWTGDVLDISPTIPKNAELAIKLYRKAIKLKFEDDEWFEFAHMFTYYEHVKQMIDRIKCLKKSLRED